MISYSGCVCGVRRAPYIYFICKSRFLYIGETQNIPIFRWSQHLELEGSFSKALLVRDPEVLQQNSPFYFFSYKCEQICAAAQPIEWKRITQFVEHQVHVNVIKNMKMFGRDLEIISDTTRTAPSSCTQAWAGSLSEQILTNFVQDWRQYFKDLPS